MESFFVETDNDGARNARDVNKYNSSNNTNPEGFYYLGFSYFNQYKNTQKETTLKLNEVILALSICSATNPIVQNALDKLSDLNGCQLHATYIIPDSEVVILNNLGINSTSEVEANIE